MTRNASQPVQLDSLLAIILRTPLERWGVPVEMGDYQGLSFDEASREYAHSRLRQELREEINSTSPQELLLLTRWGEGISVLEIASELGEPVPSVYRRLVWLQQRILSRIVVATEHAPITNPPMPRLEAFRTLRARLQLSSGMASQWQDVIREARR
jgi:hypothetical protein